MLGFRRNAWLGFRRGTKAGVAPTDVIPVSGTTYFAQDGASYPATVGSYPGAFYDPTANKTWHFTEGWNSVTQVRLARVSVFDHATGTWAGPYTASHSDLVDDDHGSPVGCMDGEGYVHVFGGAHSNNAFQYAVSASPRDARFWNKPGTMTTWGSYPHPVYVGGQIYFFSRSSANTDPDEGTLILTKTTALSGGVATWAARKQLATFGANRWYQSNCITVGNEIYMLAARANATDTIRQDVYLLIYNTTTGAIRNADSSVTVASGSQPINLTTLNASFRLRDQTTGGKQGNIPVGCLLANGNLMITYIDGTGDTATYNINVFTVTPAGVVSSDTTVATTVTPDTNFSWRTVPTIVAHPTNGQARLLWWDGRQSNTIRTATFDGSTWSAASTFFTKERTFQLTNSHQVFNAKASHSFGFCETSGDPADEQQLRTYTFGFDGTNIKRTTGQTFTPQSPSPAVSFAASPNQSQSTAITTSAVTVNVPETTPVQILSSVNGTAQQYRINGGAWQSGATVSLVNNGDTLQLGVTTPASAVSGNVTMQFGGDGGDQAVWSWDTTVATSGAAAVATVETRVGSAITNTGGERTALVALIQGFIDDGDWATFDYVAIRALPAQAHALCDYKGIRDSTITGTLPFTPNRGFTGGGASNFLQGTYNPTSHGINYLQDSAGILAWDRAGITSGTSANSIVIGTTGTVSLLGEGSGNQIACKVNYGTGTARLLDSSTTANTPGSNAAVRTASNHIGFFRNGAQTSTNTTPSTGIPNAAIVSHQDARQLIIEIVGGGWSNAAVTRIHNRISTWKTAIGA